MTEYKGYRILPADNLIGYQLQHIGRGSIPNALLGLYTSVQIAKNMIDYYLNYREGKEEVDGETIPSSGSKQIQRRVDNGRKPSNNS